MRIKRVVRREDTILRLGGVGDNWHMTWASDDLQYVGLCDGFGWPHLPGYETVGGEINSRMYAIRGYPPDVAFEYLPGYPNLVTRVDSKRQKVGNPHSYHGFGTIALGDGLYQFLSTIDHLRPNEPSRFVGAKLIYSPDRGRTWRNQDGSTPVVWEKWSERSPQNMVFFEEEQSAFALLTVLQMGRNYEANRDGYVYIYAPNGTIDGSMNELVMLRVRRERILDRRAYEFFAGLAAAGTPKWSADILARKPVHAFPRGWVNTNAHPYAWHPSVVYNAPLGLYLMANWGMGCSPDGAWFAKPSYLGFWTATAPWGPWAQIHEETAWIPGNDSRARAYQPQIAPKWIAPDGRSFWLVWTDTQFRDVRSMRNVPYSAAAKSSVVPYYAFNVQRVDIVS